MPIRQHQAADPDRGCEQCRLPFGRIERLNEAVLTACRQCGAPVGRLIAAPAVGGSRSGLDDRAENAGFHKLKRLGRGEYEKQY